MYNNYIYIYIVLCCSIFCYKIVYSSECPKPQTQNSGSKNRLHHVQLQLPSLVLGIYRYKLYKCIYAQAHKCVCAWQNQAQE